MARPRLALCLGNPGPKYSLTWHNAGFWVADALAREAGVSFTGAGLFSAVTLPCGLEIAKPATFMNESGRTASTLLRMRDMPPEELIVVCDDVNLSLGRLRLRENGSSGGHKGLASIIAALGTESFARLRLGVGPGPSGADLADFVLSKVPCDLEEDAGAMAFRAADCVLKAFTDGYQAAQEIYNRAAPGEPEGNG
jgi:PTH1 family peptidyl-tRNA hydrolase